MGKQYKILFRRHLWMIPSPSPSSARRRRPLSASVAAAWTGRPPPPAAPSGRRRRTKGRSPSSLPPSAGPWVWERRSNTCKECFFFGFHWNLNYLTMWLPEHKRRESKASVGKSTEKYFWKAFNNVKFKVWCEERLSKKLPELLGNSTAQVLWSGCSLADLPQSEQRFIITSQESRKMRASWHLFYIYSCIHLPSPTEGKSS